MSVDEMRLRRKVVHNTDPALIGLTFTFPAMAIDSDSYRCGVFDTVSEFAKATFDEIGGSRLLWEDKTHVGV
jgi:hypothetical protein